MARIKDVAKAAGVSTATVSRIINNSPSIAPETRERTLRVMKELNYIPNSMARGLSNQKSFTVALLVNIEDSKSFSNPFFYEVMHGIETIVYDKGFCLIIANQQTSMKQDNILDWLINGKRTQGVILPSAVVNAQMVKKLNTIKFPFVVIGEPYSTTELIDWVDINNRQGGMQAVNHLLEQGYRRIAFMSGNKTENFNKNRLIGYTETLNSKGFEVCAEYMREGGNSKDAGMKMMQELLDLPQRPDAVICSDNILSLGAMKAIKLSGLTVPDDIGLLSFDNYPIADLIEPTLTTVDIDVFELGIQVSNMLFRLIDNPAARQQQSLISTDIQIRESTMRTKNN